MSKVLQVQLELITTKTVSNCYGAQAEDPEGKGLVDLSAVWDLELEMLFGEGEWGQLFETIHKTSASPSWKEFQWKVVSGFFRVPNVTRHWDPLARDRCWRCEAEIGTHADIPDECEVANG